MKLKGRNAIITGAGEGLGACIAERYVAEGASVLLCARNEKNLNLVKEKISTNLAEGQRVLVQKTDVSKETDLDMLFSTAIREFKRLDVLVNNAGVYGPMGRTEEVNWSEWVEAIKINLFGTAYASRLAITHFKKNMYGKIINLSGGGATQPLPRISAYAAAKAGVVRFTETLALEVKEFNIDVNSVAPGALATRLTDQLIEAGPALVGSDFHNRMKKIQAAGGTPLEKGANLCVWLGSRDSDGITGRLISAPWDPWEKLQEHKADIENSDIYTLRRIVPKERGLNWGDI